jgi:uncharacterized protein YkwD
VGRSKRVLGSTALAIVTAAAVVLPLQGAAVAASTAPKAGSVSVASATAVKTATPAKAGGLSQATYESRLKTWINRVRHHRGIRPIAVRPCHDGFAERWTTYLTNNNQFRHQDLGRYMTRCKLSKAGEILALGRVTPQKMVTMWMHSPDHRRIMLDRSFGLSGIAAKRDANGNWVGCVDFGRRLF